MRCATILVLISLCGSSCTESNPNYLEPDAGRQDQGPGQDQQVDRYALLDLWSPADLQTWPCQSDGDCEDGLACTEDSCGPENTCLSEVVAGSCLIDDQCYVAGERLEGSPCASCDPSKDRRDWTDEPEGAPCQDDGLWCTADICSGGSCTHLASSGCVIDGGCRVEGWSPSSDPCHECLPETAGAALTFVAGKGCPVAGGGQGMCYQDACWPFQQEIYEPKVTGGGSIDQLETTLHAVASLTPSGEIWAAGGFSWSGTHGGLLVPLQTASVSMPVLTPATLRGLHHRLAVGDSGQAWYHDGKKWVAETSIMLELSGMTRSAVWGASLGGQEVYYLGDYQTTNLPGVVRCSGSLGAFSCEEHSSFATATLVGGITGSVTGGSQGPLWAASYGVSEDLFYNTGSTTSWSRSSPEACEDLGLSGATPCSNTSGDFRDLFGSGPQDIWVVGTGGIILRYDGTSWQRISGVIQHQNQTHFTAVFSSPADGLVSIAYHRQAFWGRSIGLLSWNAALARWLEPIELFISDTDLAEIRDIGGVGYDRLYLVGQRSVDLLEDRQGGWIVHLAEP